MRRGLSRFSVGYGVGEALTIPVPVAPASGAIVWDPSVTTLNVLKGVLYDIQNLIIANTTSDPGLDIAGVSLPSWFHMNRDGKYSFDPAAPEGLSAPLQFDAIAVDDFAERSVGAQKAASLSTAVELTEQTSPWNPADVGYLHGDSEKLNWSIQTAIKPGGLPGTCRVEVFNSGESSDGVLMIPFGKDYGNGDTFRFGVKFWAPPEFVYQEWPRIADTGNKFLILSHTSGSNQNWEVVAQDNSQRGLYQGYNNPSSNGFEVSHSGVCSGSDFIFQNSIDNGLNPLIGTNPDDGIAWGSNNCVQERAQLGGLFSADGSSDFVKGIGDMLSGGARITPNEWNWIYFEVVIGTFGSANSTIRMWVARENQAPVKVTDVSGVIIGAGGEGPINAVWLLPYVTGRYPGGRQISSIASAIPGVTVHTASHGVPVGAGALKYYADATPPVFGWAGAGESEGTRRGVARAEDIGVDKLTIGLSGSGGETELASGTAQGLTATTVTLEAGDTHATDALAGAVMMVDHDGGGGQQGRLRIITSNTNADPCVVTVPTWDATGGAVYKVVTGGNIILTVNPDLLPQTGTHTATVTIADGRKDTFFLFSEATVSDNVIQSPGGFTPS